jgi:hypothetical protein
MNFGQGKLLYGTVEHQVFVVSHMDCLFTAQGSYQ